MKKEGRRKIKSKEEDKDGRGNRRKERRREEEEKDGMEMGKEMQKGRDEQIETKW